MPLGTVVGLGPGDILLDGHPAPPPHGKGHCSTPILGSCLLWPDGCMDQDATWYRSRSWPRPHRSYIRKQKGVFFSELSVQICAKFSCNNFMDVCPVLTTTPLLLMGRFLWTRCIYCAIPDLHPGDHCLRFQIFRQYSCCGASQIA